MNDVIDLFMWGYQQHFQHSLQFEAESLFEKIDSRLKPSVFLLGLLVDERTDRHKVCIEPEDCGYSVEAFSAVKKLAQELEQVDEERQIFHTHPIVQENHNKRISNRALIEAISKILKRIDVYGETEKFISHPTYVDGFIVFVIIEIQKEALHRHYSLTKNKFHDRFDISRSFIESSINTYLKECSIALKDPHRGFSAIERPPDEILRESAKQFMYSISQAGENFEGLHGLYEACNMIAALKYEGSEGLGKMIVAKKDHENVRLTLQLEHPIKMSDFRKVRKFLELSNENSLIISDSAYIYGLGEQRGKYNPKSESLFIINFISHHKWEVLHDNNAMMIVEYKQPNIPKDRIDGDKFYSDLRRVFINIEKDQLDDLWDITNQAAKQKHGTMLVISDRAKEESIRLGKQSFALKPLKLTTNIIHQITSIDGSVLIDRSSVCHAIGVILDGVATDKGDSSRGARYNSAVRYYEHFGKTQPCMLVIISEDGMINLIPKLLPQIKHSKIVEAIERLTEFNKLEKIESSQYYPTLNYLESNQFYLTEEECIIINNLRKEIEKKDFGTVKIIRTDLKPNSEMNSSYYFD